MDYADLKHRYDMRSVVAQALGDPLHHAYNHDSHFCPFHSETDASFRVFADHGHCFGCGFHGDILDFFQKLHNISLTEATAMLEGTPPPPTPPRRPSRKSTYSFSWLHEQAVEANQQFNIALPYMTQRAVSQDVAFNHWVGAGMVGYKPLGDDGPTVKCRRYSLPNLRGEKVLAINWRLDEEYACQVIGENQDMVAALREQFWNKTKKNLDHRGVMYALCGPKYKRQGDLYVFNADLLWRNGAPRLWSHMLVVEGHEIDSLALLSLGYPTVAVPWKRTLDLVKAFQGVQRVVYIADNDAAGKLRGEWFVDKLGHGEIIHPPSAYKDANEACMDGEGERWLQKCGIEPAPELVRA